ncbi:MAG TPA: cation diffusion facilitator family transporter, partial [Armatimonadota bacterium]|nr:cation diffusion facilitator family transporter [Armatimonadota bacterium]
ATPQKTYGYHRLEILAAFVNGLFLLVLALWISVEAVGRLRRPPEVMGIGMLAVAAGGLAVNLLGALWLHQGHQRSLNVKAAFYHIVGDLLGSIGAVVAGLLILLFDWRLADPLLAIAIAVIIAVGAVRVVRDTVDVLLEATPAHLDLDRIRAALYEIPGVNDVHDLHAWTITSGMYALSCHCVVASDALTNCTMEAIRGLLHERFGLAHHTIQLETRRAAWCTGEHA